MEPLSPPFPIRVFDVLESTNDSILEAGEAGAPEGTTHIALEQTRGRGRGEHSWWSPAGAGLWMSTLLWPRCPRHTWSGLSLVAGTAVRSALADLDVRNVDLYWPNDLYVGDRKLGGILAEVRGREEHAWIALGIGINIDLTRPQLRARMPAELRGRIVCLTEAGPPSSRDPRAIALRILERLAPLYRRFQEGKTRLPKLVGEDLAHRGRRVSVLRLGRPALAGVVVGLGDEGELLVESGGGVHTITAGEVLYER